MKKVSIKEWAEELLVTTEPQTQLTLYDGTGYCCIGIYGKMCGYKMKNKGNHNYVYNELVRRTETNLSFFWELNDTDGLPFKTIGEIILEKLANGEIIDKGVKK